MRQPNGEPGAADRPRHAAGAAPGAGGAGDDAGQGVALGEQLVLLLLEQREVLSDGGQLAVLLLAHGQRRSPLRGLGGAQRRQLVALLLQVGDGLVHAALLVGDGLLLRGHVVPRLLEAATARRCL